MYRLCECGIAREFDGGAVYVPSRRVSTHYVSRVTFTDLSC